MKCAEEGCNKFASFGDKDTKPKYCRTHKLPIMINLITKKCEHYGCDSLSSSFNIKGKKGKFCSKHKTSDMIDVKTKSICKNNDCRTRPSYGLKGEKATHCEKHHLPDMINITGKRCAKEDCDKHPRFNIKGGVRLYCATHKLPNMVNVAKVLCNHSGCEIPAIYNIKDTKPKFCKNHKEKAMINLTKKKCSHKDCDTRPSYGLKQNNPTHCSKHKLTDMIDVVSKLCEYHNCYYQASFNIKGTKKGKFCLTHKTPEMVNVKHTLCSHEDCPSRPTFGTPGSKPSKCRTHRSPGMLRRSNGKCLTCIEPAIYGKDWTAKHCELHKQEDEFNLLEKPCVSCGLLYVLDANGKCELCNPTSFKIARLAKQTALMAYLDSKGLKGDSTDVMIDGGVCGKERPDRTYDFGDKIIIVECDEHQHRDRACLCEQTRMVNIGQAYGGIPVYFIRFNPDDYTSKIETKDPVAIQKRYKVLSDLLVSIRDGKTTLTEGLVSALYMYYDEWSCLAEEEWKCLL